MPMLRQDAFWVKLHALHRPFRVPYTLNDAAWRFARDAQAGRQRVPLARQAVVADGAER